MTDVSGNCFSTTPKGVLKIRGGFTLVYAKLRLTLTVAYLYPTISSQTLTNFKRPDDSTVKNLITLDCILFGFTGIRLSAHARFLSRKYVKKRHGCI